MTRYTRNRKQMLHERAMSGVVARERIRIASAESMVECGRIVTSGCLGDHDIRLLAWPDDSRMVAVVVDGVHKRPRTVRGVWGVVVRMIGGTM